MPPARQPPLTDDCADGIPVRSGPVPGAQDDGSVRFRIFEFRFVGASEAHLGRIHDM